MFETELFICIKIDLTLNNQQKLICHKTQTTNQVVVLFDLLLVVVVVVVVVTCFIALSKREHKVYDWSSNSLIRMSQFCPLFTMPLRFPQILLGLWENFNFCFVRCVFIKQFHSGIYNSLFNPFGYSQAGKKHTNMNSWSPF